MATDHEFLQHLQVLIAEQLQPTTHVPTGPVVIPVNAGASLQTAYENAPAGSTLALERGATFDGFTARPKAGASARNRVTVTTRDWAAAEGFAGLVETHQRREQLAKILPASGAGFGIDVPNGANSGCLNLVGLEVLPIRPSGAGSLIRLGNGKETNPDLMAHDIGIAQVYLHGSTEYGTKRGIEVNASDVTIDQAWIEEVWITGQDTQSISTNVGRRVGVRHCYLQAGGENFMVGGDTIADPRMVPMQWSITDAILHKPLRWLDDYRLTGRKRQVKNLFEVKHGRDITAQRILMVNNWGTEGGGAQDGRGILLNYDTNGNCPNCGGLEDVLLEDIALLNSPGGVNFQGYSWQDDRHNARKFQRGTVRHLYFHSGGGTGWPLAFSNVKGRHDWRVERSTFAHKGRASVIGDFGRVWEGEPPALVKGGPMKGLALVDNVFTITGRYGITAPSGIHDGAGLRTFVDEDLDVRGNVFGGASATFLSNLNAVGSGNVRGESIALEALATATAFGAPSLNVGADPDRLAPVLSWLAYLPEP